MQGYCSPLRCGLGYRLSCRSIEVGSGGNERTCIRVLTFSSSERLAVGGCGVLCFPYLSSSEVGGGFNDVELCFAVFGRTFYSGGKCLVCLGNGIINTEGGFLNGVG